MCTSLSMYHGIFGRNLDLHVSFGQQIVITPRNYPFHFQKAPVLSSHAAIIGTATVMQNYPLYAEAMNEHGLYMAGLNFPGNADYDQKADGQGPLITPFELIPWILGQCENIQQAKQLLSNFQIRNEPFSPQMPLAPLHWQIADAQHTLVCEIMTDGIHVYDDPIGVLTNNPPFPFHQMNIRQYRHLSAHQQQNTFTAETDLSPFCEGMGAIGLPGDASSPSRYVKAAFLKSNAPEEKNEEDQIIQFFHILDAVSMVKGSVLSDEKQYDLTLYSCAISKKTKTYYYKTYHNNQIHCLCMNDVDLNGDRLTAIPMIDQPQFDHIQP